MKTIIDRLNSLLKSNPYFVDNNGDILKERIKTSALNLEDNLMDILLNDEILKKYFFKENNGYLIFDKYKFANIVTNTSFLPDSYTAYKNKIGLIDEENNFIKNKDDVLLSFPYKDCVLEFDSTKTSDNRNEVFINEIVAKDEIDVLLSKKVLSNAKLYVDKNNEQFIQKYSNENILIKGNNLIALHCLKGKFKDIQLMYWDILYNTKDDKVPYNDSFKHSSWLTMMKNRLEIGWELLREGGFFVIECDKNEDAYLKVLCDEVFGRDNFINHITLESSTPSGTKLSHRDKTILKTKDTLLVYGKGKVSINPQYTVSDNLTNFTGWLDTENGNYVIKKLRDVLIENKIINKKDKLDDIKMSSNKKFEEFVINNADKIFRKQPSMPDYMKTLSKKTPNEILSYKDEDGNEYLCQNGYRFAFLSSSVRNINGEQKVSKLLCDIWTDISFHGTQYEGNENLPAGKKPERLIIRILDMFTKPGDLVCDAYFGSGTTGAVAIKTGRRFIGIEQLDEHFNKSVSRLKYVISGQDNGPVSDELNYQGGGSFISCELLKDNQIMINRIIDANEENIISIYKEIIDSPFVLNYKVDTKLISEIHNEEEFNLLSLKDKKKILVNILDKNLLYINLSDIDDIEKNVSNEDKLFTNSFYLE